jgi:hypothetical protein
MELGQMNVCILSSFSHNKTINFYSNNDLLKHTKTLLTNSKILYLQNKYIVQVLVWGLQRESMHRAVVGLDPSLIPIHAI